MMDSIEYETPAHVTCACCAGRATNLTRFLTRDGRVLAAWFLNFTEGHADPHAFGLIGLGEWSDAHDAADRRVAVSFMMMADGSLRLTDAATSPWQERTMLGRGLSRAEALSHPGIAAVYALTDRMMGEDAVLQGYFQAA